MPDNGTEPDSPLLPDKRKPTAGKASVRRLPRLQQRRRLKPGSEERIASLWLHGLTLSLALLASGIFLVTEPEGARGSLSVLAEILLTTLSAISLAVYVRRREHKDPDAAFILPLMVFVALLSLVWEPVQRTLLGTGRPFEMMVMFSQKNLLLALAVCGSRPSYQRLSMLLGVCLAIFCAVIAGQRSVYILIVIYGIGAIGWLISSYWETLQLRLLTSESRRVPRTWLLAGGVIPLLLLLATTSSGSQLISAVNGFLPGSGGTGKSDQFARGGVNDGDGLVAGKDNIRSFGPIEDAPFADDRRPSLYDVVNDLFDEPVRRPRDQAAAVALPPELMAAIQQRMAKSGQASREFSTLRRRGAADQKRIRDLRSTAMFYVAGRVPLHLRMELYDVFDGMNWYPMSREKREQNGALSMTTVDGRPWLKITMGARWNDLFTHTETHAVKIINLMTKVIPAPLDTRGLHIDKVDRRDMFSLQDGGLIRMNRESLPELLPIQILSDRVDRSFLADNDDLVWIISDQDPFNQLPSLLHIRSVRELAEKWVEGLPRGWQQVEAVCEKLRTHYVLDRDAVPPTDCQFPIGDFLFRSRRGPDYQFAGAAAVLLRSLKYPTRLVSGFYADPKKYDSRHLHTAVHGADAHFWCEVNTGSGTWVTVEPSPGYEILCPPPGIWRRVMMLMVAAGELVLRYWQVLSVLLLALSAMFILRRQLLDGLWTFCWGLFPAATERDRVLQTVRLIDRRLKYFGMPRPDGVTFTWWLRSFPALRSAAPAIDEFAELANRAGFCPGAVSAGRLFPSESEKVEQCCRQISAQLTIHNCRRSPVLVREKTELRLRGDLRRKPDSSQSADLIL